MGTVQKLNSYRSTANGKEKDGSFLDDGRNKDSYWMGSALRESEKWWITRVSGQEDSWNQGTCRQLLIVPFAVIISLQSPKRSEGLVRAQGLWSPFEECGDLSFMAGLMHLSSVRGLRTVLWSGVSHHLLLLPPLLPSTGVSPDQSLACLSQSQCLLLREPKMEHAI